MTMMILYSSPTSPFGRKVKLAAAMLGLTDQINVVLTDTMDPNDKIRTENPLGKIPTLVPEKGAAIFDSTVIVEYLDWRAGGGILVPPPSSARFLAKTQEALADGICEAAVLQVYEKRFREEGKYEPKWLGHQGGKVDRGLTAFEREQPSGKRTVADVALACALGFLDLRFEGQWRAKYPKLVAWLEVFAAEVPAFETTRFRG